jgi:dipeptide/tripeptide permease
MNFRIFRSFPRTFWISNSIELLERWAWYGFFMLLANYLTESSDKGGLEFSQSEKGWIMGTGTAILYFLPVITGSIADRFGYKKVLTLAFTIYVSAFLLLPHFDTFTSVFIMYIYLAIGGALFKPVITATIAKTTNDGNSSIGFGLFYMMVNMGAFFGPMLSLLFKEQMAIVFYISASMIALNFVLLLFYKEPDRTTDHSSNLGQDILNIFKNIGIVLTDIKFVIFLIIVSGFWTMYNQLFYTLAVFINQWIDSSALFNFFEANMPFISDNYGVNGQMKAEFITSLDAMFIMLFQIIVSSIVMRLKPLSSMITGIIVASIGMSLSFFTQDVVYTILALLVFSIGEMSASPKITEYIGKIAPKDKKALYMGYAYLPLFLGNIFAAYISGKVYEDLSDKNILAQKFAESKQIVVDAGLTLNQKFISIAEQAGMKEQELTQHLWDTANPSSIWTIILAIGLTSALSLAVYNYFLGRKTGT